MLIKLLRAAGLVAAVAVTATAVAQDELSKGDRRWMESDVGAIITQQEKAIFQEINKDDRKLFKELFWMRRDFNPGTPDNEFRKGFEQRVKIANDNFEVRGRKGSESDMGKIFLLLGNPSQQQRGRRAAEGGLPSAASATTPGGGPEGAGPGAGAADPGARDPGFPADFGGGAAGSQNMTWVYDPDPALGIPDGLAIEFRQQRQFGYRITNFDDIEEQLERVKQRLVTNPGINYARDEKGRLREPDDKFDPNSPAKKALAALRETGEESPAIQFEVHPKFFEASGGQTFIPVDIIVTEGLSDKAATVFGSIENADGFEIFQFEEPAEIEKDNQGALAYEMPFQLMPGLYTLYLGVMDEKANVYGTKILDLEVPGFESEELTLSSVLLFAEREEVGEEPPHAGKAFNLAGSHLVPKRSATYSNSDDLQGIFYAYNFGLENGQPNLSVQYRFWLGEQGRGQTADDPVQLVNENFAVIPFGFPLSIKNFEEPGDYRVEIVLTDHVTGETTTDEFEFTIGG